MRTLGVGGGGWGGPDFIETEARPRTMGILAVDLIDMKKKEMVWRGQATVDMVANPFSGV